MLKMFTEDKNRDAKKDENIRIRYIIKNILRIKMLKRMNMSR